VFNRFGIPVSDDLVNIGEQHFPEGLSSLHWVPVQASVACRISEACFAPMARLSQFLFELPACNSKSFYPDLPLSGY
jgi:hypothetical protein